MKNRLIQGFREGFKAPFQEMRNAILRIAANAKIDRLRSENDRLQEICASAYILAGVVDAPVRFLDVLSNPCDATQEQIEALLPVAEDEIGAFGEGAGEVVVTRNPAGQIVAVTRQDEEGRITSVIAEAECASGVTQLVPVKPSIALLRPFYDCPPEELELAWQAMILIASNQQRKTACEGK